MLLFLKTCFAISSNEAVARYAHFPLVHHRRSEGAARCSWRHLRVRSGISASCRYGKRRSHISSGSSRFRSDRTRGYPFSASTTESRHCHSMNHRWHAFPIWKLIIATVRQDARLSGTSARVVDRHCRSGHGAVPCQAVGARLISGVGYSEPGLRLSWRDPESVRSHRSSSGYRRNLGRHRSFGSPLWAMQVLRRSRVLQPVSREALLRDLALEAG